MNENPVEAAQERLYTLSERWEVQREFYQAGVVAALFDALILARDSGQPPPDWAVEGAINVVGDRLIVGHPIGPGPTGNELSKYKKAMAHFRRWQAVRKAKEKGLSWGNAYTYASNTLHGTFAAGAQATMKNSYLKVTKAMSDPVERLQFYSAMKEAQELTGTPAIAMG